MGRIRLLPRLRAWPLMILALIGVAGVLGACGDSSDDQAKPEPTTTTEAVATATTAAAATATSVPIKGDIVVFAASSLTESFKEAGTAFETKYPGTKVTFSFAASSALAVQINEGAPADVFASADTTQMKNVVDKGNATASDIFVKNMPVVVVPKSGSPVAAFADLAKPGVRLVLAGSEVPVGRYSREILANASKPGGVASDFSDKVLANLKSDEANVRAVLTKVQLGEADAGIVYKTDVGAAKNDVSVVEIPTAFNVVATYPIAVVKAAKNKDGATAFVAFIRSEAGQAILSKYGFVKP